MITDSNLPGNLCTCPKIPVSVLVGLFVLCLFFIKTSNLYLRLWTLSTNKKPDARMSVTEFISLKICLLILIYSKN